jgi:GH25 family lysozyme M1 (1,4-beta-N-acetylmuramidase)
MQLFQKTETILSTLAGQLTRQLLNGAGNLIKDRIDLRTKKIKTITKIKIMLQGIDISRYQDVKDYSLFNSSGIAFCYIKATDGTALLSTKFATQWEGVGKTSVMKGAYHFFRPTQDPKAQADFFISTVKSVSAKANLRCQCKDLARYCCCRIWSKARNLYRWSLLENIFRQLCTLYRFSVMGCKIFCHSPRTFWRLAKTQHLAILCTR